MKITKQQTNQDVVEDQHADIYIPEEVQETESDQKLIELHKVLVESYGDEAPLLSQLEAWKSKWSNINVSKIGADRKETYVWRTLLRFEYKKMNVGEAAENPESFNEMIVEQCLLFPTYDYTFRQQSDAGIITTLGQQISYRSGFVSPQEALSLVYIA